MCHRAKGIESATRGHRRASRHAALQEEKLRRPARFFTRGEPGTRGKRAFMRGPKLALPFNAISITHARRVKPGQPPAARILLRGKTAMTAAAEHQEPSTWISTAAALPVQGQSVEFMLAARECPIIGVYSGDGFRSRWTHYASELVSRWRGAIGETAFDPEAARH
jgi:hypothetical protein